MDLGVTAAAWWARPEWWAAIGALGSLAVLVWYTVCTQRMVHETQRMRRAQMTPCVVVYPARHPEYSSMMDLVIENAGQGPAFDIKFTLAESARRLGFGSGIALGDLDDTPFGHGVPVLPPGGKRTVPWGRGESLRGFLSDLASTPEITATYLAADGAEASTTSPITAGSIDRVTVGGTSVLQQLAHLQTIANSVASLGDKIESLAEKRSAS